MPTRPKNRPLWLALHFPHLALDVVTRGIDTPAKLPVAISDNDARKQQKQQAKNHPEDRQITHDQNPVDVSFYVIQII